MFDKSILKMGTKEMLQDFGGAFNASILISLFFSSMTNNFVINGQTITANSGFPFLLALLPRI